MGQRPCSRGSDTRALGSGGASGVIVRAMRLCPHCGTQNPSEATGCASCGKPIASLSQTVVGFSPPQAERRFRGTMIGIAPPAASPPAPPAPPPAPAPAAQGPGLRQTMIGIAPLGPSGQAPPPTGSPPAQSAQNSGYPTPPPPPEAGPLWEWAARCRTFPRTKRPWSASLGPASHRSIPGKPNSPHLHPARHPLPPTRRAAVTRLRARCPSRARARARR